LNKNYLSLYYLLQSCIWQRWWGSKICHAFGKLLCWCWFWQ